MKALELLFEFYAVPFYPATIIFLIACIRSFFLKKGKIGPITTFIGLAFAVMPSIFAIGFVAYDLIFSEKYDQHWITAIVFVYAGVGVLINMVSFIIFVLYLLRRRKIGNPVEHGFVK